MSRVAEYQDQKPKLNLKKVFGVIILLILIPVIVFGIVYAINEYQFYNVKRNILQHYFVSYVEDIGKYGVIDASGEIVLENEYDELILIPNKEKDLFLVTENVNYEDGTFEVKALNKNGNIVVKDYENLKPIEYPGDIVEYDGNLLQYEKDGKFGFVRFDGTEAFKNVFEEVKTMDGVNNKLLIKEEGKYGVINTETTEYIVPALYKKVEPLMEDTNTPYIVRFDSKDGLIGSNGKELLPSEYDKIEKNKSLDFFKATKGSQTNIYNKEGKVAVKGNVRGIIEIKDNLIIYKDGTVGAMDFKKKDIIPKKYQEIRTASINKYIVKLKGKYNVRDKENEKLLEEDYNSIIFNPDAQIYIASNDSEAFIYDIDLELKLQGIISNIDTEKGFIEIYYEDELKLYNLQFEEKTEKDIYPENNLILFKNEEGKFGYKNTDDKIIVDPIYDDAKMQNRYGYLAVNKDGHWGVLNYNGAIILEPSLDLSEHIIIDFINGWNYDKNLDLNIYTKTTNKNVE